MSYARPLYGTMSACLQPSLTPPPVAAETRSTPSSRSKSTATTGTVRLEDLRAGLAAVGVQVCGRTPNQLRFGCTFVRPSRILEAFGGRTKGRGRERERENSLLSRSCGTRLRKSLRSTELKRCQRVASNMSVFVGVPARGSDLHGSFFSFLYFSLFFFCSSKRCAFVRAERARTSAALHRSLLPNFVSPVGAWAVR